MENLPNGSAGLKERALERLHALVGNAEASFHQGQFEAIEALVARRERALVVQRTGWGKSAVYFIATALLREQGSGPTILISPLLALMRDQLEAAERAGVRAAVINSANRLDWGDIQDRLNRDEVDVLLVSPERLNNVQFRDEQLPSLLARTGMLVIDEAHCISDWGHDFRPDYRRIKDIIGRMPAGTPILATTATANSRVVADIEEQLSEGAPVTTLRGPLTRKSLRLGSMSMPSPRARLGWLLEHLDDFEGSGIIYALTISAAEDTANMLANAGYEVRSYTGRTDPQERIEAETALKENRVKALVATSALGMGFDKPDLGFVIHMGAPSSPVAYYQQVGRAGRATDNADVLLLPGNEDSEIWDYFATASMPSQVSANKVLEALAEAGTLSAPALESRVNVRRAPLELLLKVLDVDGAVEKVSGGWRSTGAPWTYDEERYRRIQEARVKEQRTMLDYENTKDCRMLFLARSLDDPEALDPLTAQRCGRCDNCAGAWYATGVSDRSIAKATSALGRVGVEIEARKLWPKEMPRLGIDVRGAIAEPERFDEGRALGRYTDLGWGASLRQATSEESEDAPVSENLLKGAVKVLSEWEWSERPVAIVSMPSVRHPRLVSSLARGLSEIGRIPYLGELSMLGGGPDHAPGGNSAFRLRDVWGKFAVPDAGRDIISNLEGPVLLVDDLVDSRWSATVAAKALKDAGAKGVLLFALAQKA